MDSHFDYIIVGGGPSGLTMATLISRQKDAKVLLVEGESALGGCHRVLRQDSLFTEHSPRVYSSSYENVKTVLNIIGTDFYDIFKKYNVDFNSRSPLKYFSAWELCVLTVEFLKKISGFVNTNSMHEYSRSFSPKARDYIDRICRLTDGATSKEYSVDKFLSLLDQTAFYAMYQPKESMDRQLMPLWEKYLRDNNVVIVTGMSLTFLDPEKKRAKVAEQYVTFDKEILAITPKDILNVTWRLQLEDAFLTQLELESFVKNSRYITYISVTFHWSRKLPVDATWGFPTGKWGIVFTQHYNFDSINSFVISASITIPEKKGGNSLTAYECKESELIEEIFSQLKSRIPSLPKYENALVSPTMTRSRNGEWTDKHVSYVDTVSNKNRVLPVQSKKFPWLYNVGTHSGLSSYKFNSMETAVENSMHVYNSHFSKTPIRVKTRYTISKFIRFIILIMLIIHWR